MAEMKTKKRGCRAGRNLQEKKRGVRPFVPSVILGKVNSLANKTDDLSTLVRQRREVRECSLLCFTETSLTETTPDSAVNLEGFKLVRADRNVAGESNGGGGLSVFINDGWCHPGNVNIREQFCTKDIEFLAVGIRPFYIPREFSHVIVFAVIIPPSADASAAYELLHDAVSRMQTRHPQVLLLVCGDFHQASLSSTLSAFTQFVEGRIGENNTEGLFYANIEGAYVSAPLAALAGSDLNLVRLRPDYTPVVRREPAQKRHVKVWTEEAHERLKDCFETTDWESLCRVHGGDAVIADYVSFCVETAVPTHTVRYFANTKPWMTPELQAQLNYKKVVFASGDRAELKRVQRDLKYKIRKAKDDYQKSLEEQPEQSGSGDCPTETGQEQSGTGDTSFGDQPWAHELNKHLNQGRSGAGTMSFGDQPWAHELNKHLNQGQGRAVSTSFGDQPWAHELNKHFNQGQSGAGATLVGDQPWAGQLNKHFNQMHPVNHHHHPHFPPPCGPRFPTHPAPYPQPFPRHHPPPNIRSGGERTRCNRPY